mmetsp:Transcript_11013/g.28250  ORF Transcript_11013/g.28250 Transcript_11013/m.28250 type:complete len:249 (+) Transcript_11013:324-1070(+)
MQRRVVLGVGRLQVGACLHERRDDVRLAVRGGVVQWRPALRVGHVHVLADGDEVLHSLGVAILGRIQQVLNLRLGRWRHRLGRGGGTWPHRSQFLSQRSHELLVVHQLHHALHALFLRLREAVLELRVVLQRLHLLHHAAALHLLRHLLHLLHHRRVLHRLLHLLDPLRLLGVLHRLLVRLLHLRQLLWGRLGGGTGLDHPAGRRGGAQRCGGPSAGGRRGGGTSGGAACSGGEGRHDRSSEKQDERR